VVREVVVTAKEATVVVVRGEATMEATTAAGEAPGLADTVAARAVAAGVAVTVESVESVTVESIVARSRRSPCRMRNR